MLHLAGRQSDDSQYAHCERSPHTISLVALDPDPSAPPAHRSARLWWICPTSWCLEALGKYLAQFSD